MDFVSLLFFALVLMGIGTCRGADWNEILHTSSFISVPKSNSYYHLIQHSEPWHDAVRTCKLSVGGNLLAIDSPEEQMALNEILDIYGPEKYWTAGRFTPNGFVWDVNNQAIPIRNSTAWAPSHPIKEPNSETRVIFNHYGKWSSNWTTGSSSEAHKFICEVERKTNSSLPLKCSKNHDLVIVLDSSKSIGQGNYTATKNFLATLAEALTASSTSRLSFIIYGNTAKLIFALNNNLTTSARVAAIRATEYLKQNTWTNTGLDLAIKELDEKSQGAPKLMLVLTDGISNNPNLTAASAQRAAKQNISVFAIGLGHAPIRKELLVIAGGKEDRVMDIKFDKLTENLEFLSIKLCP